MRNQLIVNKGILINNNTISINILQELSKIDNSIDIGDLFDKVQNLNKDINYETFKGELYKLKRLGKVESKIKGNFNIIEKWRNYVERKGL